MSHEEILGLRWIGENVLYAVDKRLIDVISTLDLALYIKDEFFGFRRIFMEAIENVRMDNDNEVIITPKVGKIVETYGQSSRISIENLRIYGPLYLEDIFEGLNIDYVNSVGLV